MKREWIIGAAIVAVAGFVMWSNGNRSAQARSSPPPAIPTVVPDNFAGNWQISNCSVAGIAQISTAEVSIGMGATEALLGTKSITFLPTTNEVTQIEVCATGDLECWGGGGPRKGICRVNSDGQLEILEARAASYASPVDFSAASIANSVYTKLSPLIAE